MKTFYTRTLSAIIFAAVMLTGMLWNTTSFCLLFLVIALLAMREYFLLIEKIQGFTIPTYLRILVILLIPAGFLITSGKHFNLINQSALFVGLQLFIFLLMLLLVITGLNKTPHIAFQKLGYSLLGILYIGLPFALMIHLRWNFSKNDIPLIPLGIIFSLWINDSLAYITGSLIGKTKFFPSISPKKTWEGTLGGIILTLVAGAIYGFTGHTYSPAFWICIAGITAIVGTIGDLLESKIKRLAGVKDSGKLMPGHGGVLDRFDSLILATPFVWVMVMIFLK